MSDNMSEDSSCLDPKSSGTITELSTSFSCITRIHMQGSKICFIVIVNKFIKVYGYDDPANQTAK